MSVRITDENRIPELVQQLESLKKRKVEMGIVAPSGDKMYMIAWVHEFGIDIFVTPKMRGWFLGQGMPLKKNTTHITIPERAYFRTGIYKHNSGIYMKMENIVEQILAGKKTSYEAFDEIGEFASEKVKGNITDVKLVKTGDLRDSIGFRVRLK